MNIRSALPMPPLQPAPASEHPDIVIGLSDLSEVRNAMTEAGSWRRLTADEICLTHEYGTFVVRSGREILLDPTPTLDLELAHILLLGPPLAALLQQRGYLLLHGSAVAIDGHAVVFVGASGMGKSTTAAAFHARGFELVVDDVAAVRFDDGRPFVQPGFPQFKLWPDALHALGEDPTALPRLDPDVDKRARRVADGFSTPQPLPLRRVYFLEWGTALAVRALEQRDAFLRLSAHSYGVRWMHDLTGPAFFRERAELARGPMIRALTRPRDLGALGSMLDLVEQDCRDGN